MVGPPVGSRGSWAIGSAAFRAELRTRLIEAEERASRFPLLGADLEAVRQARNEHWEDQLQKLAATFDIALTRLPRKKSAPKKLTLAAAMKQTTSVSRAWLARRLQIGVSDSISSLLHRFRASGATEHSAFQAALSGFRP